MAKVAVVAVHGVADQQPAESARAIADLLCADPAYGSFTEVPLRIARERMEPEPFPDKADYGLQYMRDQLAGYPKPGGDAGAVYDTVRLEGARKTDGTEVHVHEVYWADLSRAGQTWYRLLAEFYQLILHLPSLGRNGLRYTAKANGGTWKAAYNVQRFAVWMLTIPAVILNVVLLSLGVITMSAEIPPNFQKAAAIAAGTIILAALVIGVLRALSLRKLLWATWPLIIGASGGAAFLAVQRLNLYKALALEATIVAAAACLFVAAKYKVMKPNALQFGIVATAAMAGIAGYLIWNNATDEGSVYAAAVETAQYLHPLLVFTWVMIFAGAIAAAIAGIVAALSTPKEERRAAWHTIWTARLSLGLPATLFAIFTLSIWYLVIEGIAAMAPSEEPAKQIRAMLFESTRGLEFFVIALAIFLVAALLAVLPSVLVEIKPPRTSTDDESMSLGRWLSGGIRLIAAAADVFTVALAAILLLSVFPQFALIQPTNDQAMRGLSMLLASTGGVVAALLTSKRFIKTFRGVVDVLLDVDNYLRESPRDATPRARIAERYVSLLRHLCASEYQKIIIVAHSQGTVISADVLRYLAAVPDPRITGVPIRLFTMGSPLRQLYAAAFPSLYSWIESPGATAPAVAPAIIADDAPPIPTGVNVEVWANAYRSGDYVGRNLWLDDKYARLWINTPDHAKDEKTTRVQFCIGAGAHTHYWNKYAGAVGTYLCELIGPENGERTG